MRSKCLIILTGMLILIIFLFPGLLPWQSINAEASNSKHYVMIHGSWHGSWQWYKVKTILEQMGNKVTDVNLTAHSIEGTRPEITTLDNYIAVVNLVLENAESPVVLVAHSMGGIVANEAAMDNPDKIERIIYIAAFLVPAGQTLGYVASQDENSLVGPNLIPACPDKKGDPQCYDIDRANIDEIFYNTTSAIDITLAESLLTLEPAEPFIHPVRGIPAGIPLSYIRTTNDMAISPEFQDFMLLSLPEVDVHFINSDHSPFLNKPLVLSLMLVDITN